MKTSVPVKTFISPSRQLSLGSEVTSRRGERTESYHAAKRANLLQDAVSDKATKMTSPERKF